MHHTHSSVAIATLLAVASAGLAAAENPALTIYRADSDMLFENGGNSDEGYAIVHEARALTLAGGQQSLVVDGLPSLVTGGPSLDEDLAGVVRELKILALDRDVAILATAPLPNLAERPDRRPTLDDFGALGTIKQLADVVLGLFRQDMYEPARDIAGATELMIRKNRDGPTGYVDLYFYAQWMRFEDMLDPDR